MTAHTRRGKHHCKNHPRLIARGKCATCGKWVCAECSTVRGGKFFCVDTCSDVPPVPSVPAAQTSAPTPLARQQRQLRNPEPFLPWLGTGLALLAIVLAAWQWSTARHLDIVNQQLQGRQSALERDLQSTRDQLDLLGAELSAFRDSIAPPARVHKARRGESFDLLPSLTGRTGVPLSLDNGATDKPLVCLTFDGGSYANAAGDILDTLKSRGVKATMFVTGGFVRRYPDVVRRMVAEGHEIGNHTNSHPHLTSWETDHTHTLLPAITQPILRSELAQANEAFRSLIGADMAPLWRAPYGEKNSVLCSWGQGAGYLHVGWKQGQTWRENLDSYDWVPDEETPGYHTPEEIHDKIMTLARSKPAGINGGIILMHLGTERKETGTQVHRMLGRLIEELRDMGYTLVTASEMARLSGVDLSLLQR
jgi:peptidoglycan/xylan/chitin deacetylase (PgdA/CDA1 family)